MINKKPYITEFRAVDPKDGSLKTWSGETIWAESWEAAQAWCTKHQGHLLVIGELISEIPTDDFNNPLWDKKIDYDQLYNKANNKTDNTDEAISNTDK